ncbi:MAG TPA: YtxH domain-containing protein [Anaerolineaceae bacterium]
MHDPNEEMKMHHEMHHKGGSRFSAFVWGALIGAGVALLTARRTGEETRQMLKERQSELMNQANDLAKTAREKAVEKVEEVKTRAEQLQYEAQDRGRNLVEQAKVAARGYVESAAGAVHEAADKVEDAAGVDKPLKDEAGLVQTNSEKDFPL